MAKIAELKPPFVGNCFVFVHLVSKKQEKKKKNTKKIISFSGFLVTKWPEALKLRI